MKNDLCWTKTILTVYKYLERISGAIDKIVEKSALASFNIIGQNYHNNNTLSISNKIIELSERKVTLINLKVLVEQTFLEISEKDAQILIEKYVDGRKTIEVADRFELSLRTCFRRISSAENSFKSKLCAKGYNDIKIADMLKDEGWIIRAYNNIATKEGEFEISNSYLEKAVSM